MSDSKLEYINNLHQRQAAVQQLLDGVALVQSGGVEGMQVVAMTQPEILINVITLLTATIEAQQKEILLLAEDAFDHSDFLDKMSSIFD
jgi:hypothetical protein